MLRIDFKGNDSGYCYEMRISCLNKLKNSAFSINPMFIIQILNMEIHIFHRQKYHGKLLINKKKLISYDNSKLYIYVHTVSFIA